ncbi:hypothetical protein [Vibrio breoganii]|uniref:hypothetical protein n=1 Tax=Vibrio breoganii TaxID=553239 RepID=UPI0021C28D9F|nr:hypothetical protein [Vibrio breoganii]MDN3715930.1 hypothetical protein [Vibrio breoganii]
MNIGYIIDCEFDILKPNSVVKKVLLQTKYWLESGHDVSVYSVHSGTVTNLRNTKTSKISEGYLKNDSSLKKLSRIWGFYRNISHMNMFCEHNLIYTRYSFYTPHLARLIAQNLVLMEINSNDDIEYRKASLFSRYYNTLFKRKILKHIDGFICVTNELSNYITGYSSATKNVIGNGIEFRRELDEEILSIHNSKPILTFVASPGNASHGLDIILGLASDLKDYHFNIVGCDGHSVDNVKYWGYLDKVELDNILKNSDFGISGMASWRHGMMEACPLKSREYCSYGLPVFGNYKDTDLQDTSVYLQVTAHSAIEKSKQVSDFVEYWLDCDERKKAVIDIAKEVLDSSTKENERISIFENYLIKHKRNK